MSDRKNHSIRDNVAAGLILAALIYLIQRFYPPFFTFLKNMFDIVIQYFSSFTSMPNTILWLLLLLTLVISVGFGILVYRVKKSKESLVESDLGSYNQQLQHEVERLKAQSVAEISNLAGFDESIKLSGAHFDHQYKYRKDMSKTITWKQIFSAIAPYLLEHPNDAKMKVQIQVVSATLKVDER